MKKFLSILLVALMSVAMVFTAVGCGDETPTSGKTGISCVKEDGKYVVYKYVDEGKGVTELDIDKAVKEVYGETAEVVRIKAGTFDGNSTLTSVIVPDTVTEIDAGAFKNMKSLQSITLPFVGANVNADAFDGQSLSDNKSVDAERLFGYVFGTEQYTGGAKITQVYNSIDGSSSDFYIPMTLRTVKIQPKDNYQIPMYSFSGLTLITKIELSGKVTAIGERAFYNANCFAELKLPVSISRIYKGAFENFSSLTKIDFAGNGEQWNAVQKGSDWNKGVSENFTIKTA